MKTLISLLLTIVVLAACAKDGTLTPQGAQGITTGLQIANLALASYAGYADATSGGKKLTDAQIAKMASDDLSGVAAIAQANLGKTPQQAEIVQGAANPTAAAAVIYALPNKPITQATVDKLQDAAAMMQNP